jgi:hypothetical protein
MNDDKKNDFDDAFREALKEPAQCDTFGKPKGNYPLGNLKTKTVDELFKYLAELSGVRTGKPHLQSFLFDCVTEEIMFRLKNEEIIQPNNVRKGMYQVIEDLNKSIPSLPFKESFDTTIAERSFQPGEGPYVWHSVFDSIRPSENKSSFYQTLLIDAMNKGIPMIFSNEDAEIEYSRNSVLIHADVQKVKEAIESKIVEIPPEEIEAFNSIKDSITPRKFLVYGKRVGKTHLLMRLLERLGIKKLQNSGFSGAHADPNASKEHSERIPLTASLRRLTDKIREGGFKRGEMAVIGAGFKETKEEYIARMTGKGEKGPWYFQFEGEPEKIEEFLGKMPDAVVAESMLDPTVSISKPWVLTDLQKEALNHGEQPLHQIVVKTSRIGLSQRLAILGADLMLRGVVISQENTFYNGSNARFSDPIPYNTLNVSSHDITPISDCGGLDVEREIREERNKRLKQMKTSTRQRGDNAKDFAARNPFMKNRNY